jgi:hypothetical protein
MTLDFSKVKNKLYRIRLHSNTKRNNEKNKITTTNKRLQQLFNRL